MSEPKSKTTDFERRVTESRICRRCNGEGGRAEITNVPWRTAKALGFGYWICPDCVGSGTQQEFTKNV